MVRWQPSLRRHAPIARPVAGPAASPTQLNGGGPRCRSGWVDGALRRADHACPSILINPINVLSMDQTLIIADPDDADWLDVDTALARLGVARQTLYAYVSRGLVRSRPASDDPRRSLYDRYAIEALIARRRRGRARNAVAASTIDWGEPVLVSRITSIEAGRLAYRGQDAVALAGW